MIKAEIVAHSLSPQRDELISVLCTFPRIILAEVNTHRMLSKNTSSSRAIPFNKMVQAVKDNPFIPIAWQKHHSGMQGSEYLDAPIDITFAHDMWLEARNKAIKSATNLYNLGGNKEGVTKQLCNRLLEPFMWTTMLITGSREGWDNFFNLRCPQYQTPVSQTVEPQKSWKDLLEVHSNPINEKLIEDNKDNWLFKLQHNKGQAEIHMMALAESIYDAVNESTPKQLKAGEWHIPFRNKIDYGLVGDISHNRNDDNHIQTLMVKISTAMAARTSYTVVGEEKGMDYQKMIDLHDRLISQDPPHSSPMEHACQAVTDEEYNNSFKGQEKGWFRNYKGFKSYRQVIEESK